jgi:putative ABC transport system permease protein
MRRLRGWLVRWGGLFDKRQKDRDLVEELESHLQMHIDENVGRGMTPEEARRQALLKLGGLEQTKENYRDRRGFPWLESVLQDIRFGLRMLRKNPGFTAGAVLTLALGIGAVTAMFTVVDGVVLKPLRYPDAGRIVTVRTLWTDSGKINPRIAGGDMQDLRAASDSFEAFSYYYGGDFGVQLARSADFGGVYLVDPNFFQVFGVPASVGRTFTSEDAGRSAVVSTGFAARNFGSASSALGQTLAVEGTPYEIVGVMPPMFQFPRGAQVWGAVSPIPENRNRTSFTYHTVAKLRPGLSPKVADARLLSIANRLQAAFPESNRYKTFTVQPLQEELAAPVRTTLFLLMAAVALVLLIACANVANLMLARSGARIREFSMRAVLGASRGRLARQLLSESILLAFGAGLLGIAVAPWGTKALLIIGARFVPAPLLGDIQSDWRVLAFALAASFLTSLVFGMAPAWQASRIDLQSALKQADARGLLGGGPARLRNSLVVAQIALSLTLAIAAGLLFRTFLALHSSPMGFRTEGILVTYASAPARTLPEALQVGRTYEDLLAKLRQIPGVISAAGAMGLPAGQYNSDGAFAIEGKQSFFGGDWRRLPYAGFRLASPGYFETMGIPLLGGRDFNDGDGHDRPFVAIISESLALQNFPKEDPIGHRIQCGMDKDSLNWMTIVGVVGDVRQSSPAAQPGPELYMPLWQHPFMANDAELVVRTPGNPESLIPTVGNSVRDVDPEIALKFTTMTELVSDSIGIQRFRTILASVFAVLALVLALSGMYAVMSYVTAQRTAEFGLRSALGAQAGNIIRLVLSGAAKLAAIGVIAGTLLSIFTGRLLSSMLFGVKSTDALTYTLVIAIVVPVVLLAAALPAWRASRVDPMVALRYE